MKTVSWWALLGCLCTPLAAQPPGGGVVTLPIDSAHDVTGKGQAFVEVLAPRNTYFVQEAIPLRLRFGVEDRFLKTSMVQLFHRWLDVPVQVQARWFEGLPANPSTGLSFALSESVAAAEATERLVGGRQFKVLEISRSHLPDDPGQLVVPAPILRFAYATRFREDFVSGRVALDRRDAFVRGKPLTLRIRPLPTEGRPPEFTGGVGRFSVRAEASPRSIEVAQSFKLALHIEGKGNLQHLDPPALEQLAGFPEGFHVLGKVDDKSGTRRTVTWDLAPLSAAVKEVPPIRLAFFDPGPPAGYRTTKTQSIPLEVRPLPEGAGARLLDADKARRPVPGVNDIFDIKPLAGRPHAEAPLRPTLAPRWIVLLAPWLLVFGLRLWLRSRKSNRGADRMRARAAADAFRARTASADSDSDIAEAFTQFLAALLGCSAAGVIAPSLQAQLEAKGLPTELAAESATLLEALVAERYGGSASAGGPEAARALVDAVEALFKGRSLRQPR